MRREMICIGCPMGCNLAVEYLGIKVSAVNGNRCKVGLQYAEKELFNPERTLTTTVRVKNGHLPLVSVKSSKPFPKSRIFEAMDLISKVEVEAPIRLGEPIVLNLLDTGVDVVATKNVSVKNSAFNLKTEC
jgi:CxxC motif-containing protein